MASVELEAVKELLAGIDFSSTSLDERRTMIDSFAPPAADGTSLEPAAAVAISAVTDLDATGESMGTRAEVDLMVRPKGMKEAADWYLAGQDPRHPYASPLYADVAGLPPALIQVGDAEVLLDDSTRFCRQGARCPRQRHARGLAWYAARLACFCRPTPPGRPGDSPHRLVASTADPRQPVNGRGLGPFPGVGRSASHGTTSAGCGKLTPWAA